MPKTYLVLGFFVFIDDLHKHIDSNRVFNFLANLQITKNNFSRDGINVVFVVAGFPSWRDKIRQNSALTGFFDAADELTLPEVTPELAAQTINLIIAKLDFLSAFIENAEFRNLLSGVLKRYQRNKFKIINLKKAWGRVFKK